MSTHVRSSIFYMLCQNYKDRRDLLLEPKEDSQNRTFPSYRHIPHCTVKNKYSKTCLKRPLSKGPQICFQDRLSPYAGQKYCRMLQGEHSAILSTFIKLPFVIKIFTLSILEWLF